MKVDAQALYDYTARSDKELSFAKGDSLQVIEKTQDHNWWDGFHEGKRGYIPVAYVEILELEPQSTLPVPAPPKRRSSMPVPGEYQSPTRTSEPPSEPSIQEVETIAVENTDPGTLKTPDLVIQSPSESVPPQPISVAAPSAPESVPGELNTSEHEKQKKSGGSVKLLKRQFQDQPQQPKVLVEPHSVHRRQHSTDTSNTGQRKGSDSDSVPRSSSTGNRVVKISSVFQHKTAPAPVPPKPKPRSHIATHPPVTSPSHHGGNFSPPDHQNQPPPVFPLMSHPQAGAGVTVSPLQRIAQQGQQKQSPAEVPKKPPPPGKSSKLKVKREKSFRTEKGPKPPPPAKPVTGYVAPSNKELSAELAARAARMKHQD